MNAINALQHYMLHSLDWPLVCHPFLPVAAKTALLLRQRGTHGLVCLTRPEDVSDQWQGRCTVLSQRRHIRLSLAQAAKATPKPPPPTVATGPPPPPPPDFPRPNLRPGHGLGCPGVPTLGKYSHLRSGLLARQPRSRPQTTGNTASSACLAIVGEEWVPRQT